MTDKKPARVTKEPKAKSDTPAAITKKPKAKSDTAIPQSVTKKPKIKSDTDNSRAHVEGAPASPPEQVKKGASKAKKPAAPAAEVAPVEVVAAPAAPAPEARRRGRPPGSGKKPAAPVTAPVAPEVAPAGQRVGYVRVSTGDQNTARQLDGVELHKVFTDKLSGKDTRRPQLAALLAHVRAGDVVLVHSLDRLGRNLADLRRLVDELLAKGVAVEFVKERLLFEPGRSDSLATLMLNMMGAFAEFERNLILERQREGIQQAKAAGRYKGRSPSLSPEQTAELLSRAAAGEQKSALAAAFGITRKAVYDYLARSAAGPE